MIPRQGLLTNENNLWHTISNRVPNATLNFHFLSALTVVLAFHLSLGAAKIEFFQPMYLGSPHLFLAALFLPWSECSFRLCPSHSPNPNPGTGSHISTEQLKRPHNHCLDENRPNPAVLTAPAWLLKPHLSCKLWLSLRPLVFCEELQGRPLTHGSHQSFHSELLPLVFGNPFPALLQQ